MNPLTDALKEILANGHERPKTPSERAWDTAREEAREDGRTVRDFEIRCIKIKGMTAWAKLLFWILTKICWESSFFLHKKRVGSVCITGRQLQANFSFPEKRLYTQTKKLKDKAGAVLGTRKVPGAIDELVRAGFIWVGKKPISNLPKNKWPNVFNLCALVPQTEQQSLGLLEEVTVVDDATTDGGSSSFFAENESGSGQTPRIDLGNPRFAPLPTPTGGSGQTPLAAVAHTPRGEQAATTRGSSATTNGKNGLHPTGVVAKPGAGGLAYPASGGPIKTVRLGTDLKDSTTGGTPPPDVEFEEWQKGLKGQFPSKLRKLETDLQARLRGAASKEARSEWKRRLDAVQAQLLGGAVRDDATKPKVKTLTSAPQKMTEAELLAAGRKVIADAKALQIKPPLTAPMLAALVNAGEWDKKKNLPLAATPAA